MALTIDEAIRKNPFNPEYGNKSAYCRYLRYNVDGWYKLDSKEVRRMWEENIGSEDKHEQSGGRMNNRQKAKHFKKLYESTLYKTVPTIVINECRELKKYRCRVATSYMLRQQEPEASKAEAVYRMAAHFTDFISEHIEYNKDAGCYEVTVWVKE